MCSLGEMFTCLYGIIHGGFDGAGGVRGAVSGSWRGPRGEVCGWEGEDGMDINSSGEEEYGEEGEGENEKMPDSSPS